MSEARHSLVILRRSRPQLGGRGRALAREQRREVLIHVNAPLLVAWPMSADAINQTSNAATYHGVYGVSYSAFNFNGAFLDESRDWISSRWRISRRKDDPLSRIEGSWSISRGGCNRISERVHRGLRPREKILSANSIALGLQGGLFCGKKRNLARHV